MTKEVKKGLVDVCICVRVVCEQISAALFTRFRDGMK